MLQGTVPLSSQPERERCSLEFMTEESLCVFQPQTGERESNVLKLFGQIWQFAFQHVSATHEENLAVRARQQSAGPGIQPGAALSMPRRAMPWRAPRRRNSAREHLKQQRT